jgi:hypothetical protein
MIGWWCKTSHPNQHGDHADFKDGWQYLAPLLAMDPESVHSKICLKHIFNFWFDGSN